MKERLWPAVAGAFVMHSLAISALAFGLIATNSSRSHNLQDNFCVEMVFHQEGQTASLEAHGAEQSTDTLQAVYKASEDVEHARENNEWKLADWLKEEG